MEKYRRLVLIIFVLTFFVFYKVDAMIHELPLLGKSIYIDPGHGA